MQKQPRTKQELEQLLIAELQTFIDCEQALDIEVVPVEDHTSPATWTVSCFNPGKSDTEACDLALQNIVPRFQRAYDMVCKH